MGNYYLAEVSGLDSMQVQPRNICTLSSSCISKPREAILVDNLCVTSFTLVCIRSGNIKITTESKQIIECEAPGMIVLEKEQTVSVLLEDINGHLSFEVLEVPHNILMSTYELLTENLQAIPTGVINHPRVVYTEDFPARREVFDSLKNKLICQDKQHSPGEFKSDSIDSGLVPNSLLFVLSFFIRHPVAAGMLSRSIKMSVKDKVYSIIYAEPERQWKLADVSSMIFMSASTLKRKLAVEGTTFSELYLTARMNLATKLLRAGKHSVSTVAVLCGYDSVSYFIYCFKKRFNITPSAFMRSINH